MKTEEKEEKEERAMRETAGRVTVVAVGRAYFFNEGGGGRRVELGVVDDWRRHGTGRTRSFLVVL